MNRQNFLKLLLAAIVLVTMSVGLVACVSEDVPQTQTETVSVWLDRYDEKTVQLESGAFSDFTWKTTNENVVTVVNDKLSAMGEGTAVVTGTKEGYFITLNVTVNDSGAKPRIAFEDTEVYKTTETTLNPTLSYNGETLDVNVEFTATVEDQTFATCQGLKVTALKEGQTQLTISGTYKGLELEKTVTLTVKPYSFIELEGDTDEFTLYNVKDSKFGYFEVPLRVVEKGEQVENPQIEYTAATDGIVTFEGNTVKAAAVGTTQVTAKNGENTVTFTVNVLPNYVEETFNNQASSSYGTVYEAYTGEEAIGGRTEGLFKYVTGTFGEESYWSHRIENSKANLSCQDAYREYGYRYFAFDLFVTQDARFLAPIGSDNDTFYAPLNEYFDVDGLKVISNGKITNKFVTGEWMTVVYDLRERIMIDASANNKYYIALNGQQLTSYLDNIRYYLDDTFLPENGVLGYEEKEGFVQANNDEFAFYHKANEELYKKTENQVGEVSGAYKLIGGEGDYKNNTLVVASSTGRTRADAIVNLKEKGNYLTFDLYIENAQSLYFAIDYGKTEVLVNVGKTDFEKVDWISLMSDGKLLHLLKQGQWITVSIEYGRMLETLNIESNSPVAIEFGVPQKDDVVYINNVRYYQTAEYLPTEYGDLAPAFIQLSDTSLLAKANNAINLTAEIKNAEESVKATLTSSNTQVVEIREDGTIFAKAAGYAVVTASYGELDSVECAIRVISENVYEFQADAYYEYSQYPYAAAYLPDSPEYDSAESLKFTFTVKDDFNYLHILTGSWGQQLNGVRIGSDSYSGFNAWNYASPGFSAADLTILDAEGNVLGSLGKKGIAWEVDQTYTAIINLAKGSKVYFFVSDRLLDTEEYWWQNGSSYYKSDLFDFVEFNSFAGIYAEQPTTKVILDKTEGILFAGEQLKLSAFVAFNRSAQVSWTTQSEAIATVENGLVKGISAGKTKIIVSAEGAQSAEFEVSVVTKQAILPEFKRFHEDYPQGALLSLDKYAGYDGISFTIKFTDANTFLTITDGVNAGWAQEPNCGVIIGPNTYMKLWCSQELPYISTDVLKIKDANGNYIDYTQGYTFETGVKYTVEYSLQDNRYLSLWTAPDATKGLFWSIGGYYGNALEHITLDDFYGLWSTTPETTVELNKTSATAVVGDEIALVATVKNASVTPEWKTSNSAVATVTNGVVKAVGVGSATITLTVGDKYATFTLVVGDMKKTRLNATLNIFHEDYQQGRYVTLENYANYDKLTFTITFKETGKFFTITDSSAAGWGVNPDYATVIGNATYKSTWGSAASQLMSTDSLKISDANGYIDYTSGYVFEQDVTYTVEYALASGRSLGLWIADGDTHGVFWSSGSYRNLADVAEVGDFYGVSVIRPTEKTRLNATLNIFHEDFQQGRYVTLENYVDYDKLTFTITFKEAGKFFTVTDSSAAGWGVNPDYATVIGNGTYKSTWGSAESQLMSTDSLKISNASGYIDYTSGYVFEQGVTYTVEYALASGRSLGLWIADTDTHGLFWKASEYRNLADVAEVGDFYGVSTIRLVEKTLLTSKLNIFHEDFQQGRYVTLENYTGYNKVSFTITFKETGKFFTITDSASAGWAVNPDYATVIGNATYKSTWGSAESQLMSTSSLKISDANGYINYTSGYNFEQGVTYTVEYALASGRSLGLWIADGDTHGLFWKAGEYRNLADVAEVGDFYGIKII